MRVSIYYQNGSLFRTVVPNNDSVVDMGIMDISSITLKFSLSELIDFPKGAFVLYNNEKYTVSYGCKTEMLSERQYDYSVIFSSEKSLLNRVVIRNLETGSVNFPYTANIEEHLSIIVGNLNKYDTSEWSVGECIKDAGVKYLQYSYVSCKDALDSLANIYGTEWEINGHTIHLRKIEHNINSPVEISYGKGNGLRPGVTTEFIQSPLTRLYTQGSDRNIDMSIYGSSILLLPKSATIRYDGEKFDNEDGFDIDISRMYTTNADGTFISSVMNMNDPINEGVLNCEDIYPVIEHKVVGHKHIISFTGGTKRYSVITLDIPESLDYIDYYIKGQIPYLTYQSGVLSGKTFPFVMTSEGKPDIQKNYQDGVFKGWDIKIEDIYIDGIVYPDYSKDLMPDVGDTCRLFGLSIPPESINDNTSRTGASWEMLKRGVSYLFENELPIYSISGEIDPIWLRNHKSVLSKLVLGGYVKYTHPVWAPDGIMMRIQRLRRSITSEFSVDVELSNGIVGGGVIKDLSDRISNQSGQLSEQSQNQNSSNYNNVVSTGDFVTLSTEQTVTGRKTFAEDVVFGADGSRLFIPSGDTPGTYDIFVDPGMAVEGEDPSAGGTETEVYRLNGLTALAAGASSSAIENAIGSFSGLLEAVRAGMVIIDAPDAANGERKTAVWAMTSGSILVGMDFHTAPDKVTRYAVTNAASGLTLAIRAYSLLTEDGTLNGLSTDAKTVPGAINELAEKASEGGGGGGASPFWYGRVTATGTATKLGGTGTVTVTRTSEGQYSIPGLSGRIVIVTPLNYHALSILQQSMHTALVTQASSTGSATVNMFGPSGTRDDYGFFMLII